jgi:hypothetical protein
MRNRSLTYQRIQVHKCLSEALDFARLIFKSGPVDNCFVHSKQTEKRRIGPRSLMLE